MLGCVWCVGVAAGSAAGAVPASAAAAEHVEHVVLVFLAQCCSCLRPRFPAAAQVLKQWLAAGVGLDCRSCCTFVGRRVGCVWVQGSQRL
jgi:hypothetical protein